MKNLSTLPPNLILTSTNQVMAELATDWASKTGGAIQRVMYEKSLKHLVEAKGSESSAGDLI